MNEKQAQDIIEDVSEAVSPIFLIQLASKRLGWAIALDDQEEVGGIALGSPDWLEANLYNIGNMDIMVHGDDDIDTRGLAN